MVPYRRTQDTSPSLGSYWRKDVRYNGVPKVRQKTWVDSRTLLTSREEILRSVKVINYHRRPLEDEWKRSIFPQKNRCSTRTGSRNEGRNTIIVHKDTKSRKRVKEPFEVVSVNLWDEFQIIKWTIKERRKHLLMIYEHQFVEPQQYGCTTKLYPYVTPFRFSSIISIRECINRENTILVNSRYKNGQKFVWYIKNW